MKKVIIAFILFSMSSISFGQQDEKVLINFEKHKFSLTTKGRLILDSVLANLNLDIISQIEICGFTDEDGDSIYNLKLSKNRALSVQKYLNSHKIPDRILNMSYKGSRQAITSSNLENEKKKNRRVEIILKYKHKTQWVNSQAVQTFSGWPTEKIVIKGKEGTQITFFENSFVDKYGDLVDSKVKIELIEVYSKSDMISNHLNTTSDGRLLESAGMVYINVSSHHDTIYLRGNFYIDFAQSTKKPGLELYYGDTTQNQINWKSQDSSYFICVSSSAVYNKTNLLVNTVDTCGVDFCLVFNKINSVMNLKRTTRGLEFVNIPVGEPATLIAFRKNETDTFFASKEIKIEEN